MPYPSPHYSLSHPMADPVLDDPPVAIGKKDKKRNRRPAVVIHDKKARTSSCHSESSAETDVDSIFSNNSDLRDTKSHYSIGTDHSVHSRHTTVDSDDCQHPNPAEKDDFVIRRRRRRFSSDRRRRSRSAGPRPSHRGFDEIIPAKTARGKENRDVTLTYRFSKNDSTLPRPGKKGSEMTREVSPDRLENRSLEMSSKEVLERDKEVMKQIRARERDAAELRDRRNNEEYMKELRAWEIKIDEELLSARKKRHTTAFANTVHRDFQKASD